MKWQFFCGLIFWLIVGTLQAEQTLVDYDFDYQDLESGPDTFQIFQHANGTVTLSSLYAFSGNRSVHLRDAIGDKEFPEFQGYFPTIKSGLLAMHFSLMSPDPREAFNIALAGKGHFAMRKDGLNFWLINDGETLRHLSDSIPKRLFTLQAHQWYQFDVLLDLDLGVYDLRIKDAQNNLLVNIKKQANAINQPASAINKYSFIGDLPDQGAADYFIDDLLIISSKEREIAPFVAPGRRKLFIDSWNDYHKQHYGSLRCLPPETLSDFGFKSVGMALDDDMLKALKDIIYAGSVKNYKNVYLQAVANWRKGCQVLQAGNANLALGKFNDAAELIPNAPVLILSLAMAHAASDNWFAAIQALEMGRSQFPQDVRWDIAEAMIALYFHKDIPADDVLGSFSSWYTENYRDKAVQKMVATGISNSGIQALRKIHSGKWANVLEAALIPEQYYFALLWQQSWERALDLALDMQVLIKRFGGESVLWIERAGNAMFLSGQYFEAERYYLQALECCPYRTSSLLKLSDVYHQLGHWEKERQYRQKIYGLLADE